MVKIGNSRSILLGRTGAGKTAILEFIRKTKKNCYSLDVAGMAFNYIANNTTVKALEQSGVELNLFYQMLWKYAICLQLIQNRWRVDTEQRDQGFFMATVDEWFRRDPRKKLAMDYFRKWQNSFWVTADENIREITSTFETEVKGKIRQKLSPLSAEAFAADKQNAEIKSQIQSVGREIVYSIRIARLNELIDLLATHGFPEDAGEPTYVLIDGSGRESFGWMSRVGSV